MAERKVYWESNFQGCLLGVEKNRKKWGKPFQFHQEQVESVQSRTAWELVWGP